MSNEWVEFPPERPDYSKYILRVNYKNGLLQFFDGEKAEWEWQDDRTCVVKVKDEDKVFIIPYSSVLFFEVIKKEVKKNE